MHSKCIWYPQISDEIGAIYITPKQHLLKLSPERKQNNFLPPRKPQKIFLVIFSECCFVCRHKGSILKKQKKILTKSKICTEEWIK